MLTLNVSCTARKILSLIAMVGMIAIGACERGCDRDRSVMDDAGRQELHRDVDGDRIDEEEIDKDIGRVDADVDAFDHGLVQDTAYYENQLKSRWAELRAKIKEKWELAESDLNQIEALAEDRFVELSRKLQAKLRTSKEEADRMLKEFIKNN